MLVGGICVCRSSKSITVFLSHAARVHVTIIGEFTANLLIRFLYVNMVFKNQTPSPYHSTAVCIYPKQLLDYIDSSFIKSFESDHCVASVYKEEALPNTRRVKLIMKSSGMCDSI